MSNEYTQNKLELNDGHLLIVILVFLQGFNHPEYEYICLKIQLYVRMMI